MNTFLVIFLVVVGVILLIAEMFILPGFGIAGISGFISLAAAVWMAYTKLTPVYPNAGHITLGACIILTVIAIYGFVKSHAIEKMALETTINSSVNLAEPGKKIDNLKAEAEKQDNNN